MQNINLSAVVLTKNNEDSIKNCLKSLVFANELVIIDDNSDDKTLKVAKDFNAKVYIRALNGDFASQRNFGLEKAHGRWVLFIDSDEVVPLDLRSEIIQLVSNPFSSVDGFYIRRQDNIWGKTLNHGENGNIRLLRLAQKGKGFWNRKVHEVWKVSGSTKNLKFPILHFPHQSLHEFIDDINKFSDLDVEAKMEEKKQSNLLKIVLWPKGKFIWNWKFKLGFLDGTQGFVMALMMSFHSFLSWAKLWVEQKH